MSTPGEVATLISGGRFDIFMAHSHRDQPIAYALSSWIDCLWPGTSIFVSHVGLAELYRLHPPYFLEAVSRSTCLVAVLSRDLVVSNDAFDELEFARRLGLPTLLAIEPRISAEHRHEIGWIIDRWSKRYGPVVDLKSRDSEAVLSHWIAQCLGRSPTVAPAPGGLRRTEARIRCPPVSNSLPLPSGELSLGIRTRQDAERLLTIHEKWLYNQLYAIGQDPARLPGLSLQGRLAALLLSCSPAQIPLYLEPLLSG